MLIESVCIVGGGSSGWMSAAIFAKTFPDMEICLIESSDIKTIGVGESTLGHFNRFLKRIDLFDKDKEWMPSCDATYKTSIGFTSFREGKGENFQYPFGQFDMIDYKDNIMRFFELQCQYGDELYPPEEFSRFVNNQTWIAEHNKIATDIPKSKFDHREDYAYHLNAGKFGEYLKNNIAIPNGVKHLEGTVKNVIKRPDGYIEAIVTTEGNYVGADLFLDCTGFKSLLLEQHCGSEFISFKNQLYNDKAIAGHIEYGDKDKEMECVTDCTGLDNGWAWNIPLWSNVGVGYVYSSKFQPSSEEALKEFYAYLKERYGRYPKISNVHHIDIKHGKHEKAWVKNVVGIGLSYAFIEPLESTGLMTTHENLIYLVDAIKARKSRKMNNFDRQSYNYSVDHLTEVMRNFIVLHWVLSQRDDTPYWRSCTEDVDVPTRLEDLDSNVRQLSLANTYALMDSVMNAFYAPDKLEGLLYIAAGMDNRPLTDTLYKERSDKDRRSVVESVHVNWQQERKFMLEWVKDQPSHYQYLKDNIYVESV